jgi:ketosteroid isomerase-like protein
VHDKMARIGTTLLSAAVVLAAGRVDAGPQNARAAIEEGGAAFSALLAKGDAAGLAAMYAADAQVFPPNSDIVTGAAAIQKVWQGVIDAGVKGAKFTIVDVTEAADLASETGRYELTGADGKVVDTGKYVVVWKRVGGRWKLLRDIWNTSQPASAAK